MPVTRNVTFTPDDWRVAVSLASDRAIESLRHDRKDRLFEKSWADALMVHVWGSVGEVAAAKYLGVYPEFSVGRFSGMSADLLGLIEVRHRKSRNWDLIIRDSDSDDRIYLLTTGEPPTIDVCGWCYGRDGKKEENRNDHGGHGSAFFVSSEQLLDPSILADEIRRIRRATEG